MEQVSKRYLGDGLYVEFDGYQFILSTERDGMRHWIALEPNVVTAFSEYVEFVANVINGE